MELPAINFIKTDADGDLGEALFLLEDVIGSEQIKSGNRAFPHHGVGLPTACLSISKASHFHPFENGTHESLNGSLIDVLIRSGFTKYVVEYEFVFFNVLCQVHFLLEFFHDDCVVMAFHNIRVTALYFFGAEGPFSHCHSNFGFRFHLF